MACASPTVRWKHRQYPCNVEMPVLPSCDSAMQRDAQKSDSHMNAATARISQCVQSKPVDNTRPFPTAAATMEVVEMVLTGRVNKSLVTLIQQAGGRAVGLCGKDSNILQARQMVEKDIGFVGEVTKVGLRCTLQHPALLRCAGTLMQLCIPRRTVERQVQCSYPEVLNATASAPCNIYPNRSVPNSGVPSTQVDAKIIETLVKDGYIPVLATVASSPTGESLNVNADIAAGEVRTLHIEFPLISGFNVMRTTSMFLGQPCLPFSWRRHCGRRS
jgi:hypothetical protein